MYKGLIALSILATTVAGQTTQYFRISADIQNVEILNLHKWGVMVWSNQLPFETPWSTCKIQSSPTLNGPWTDFTNGWPFVGHSNMYSQIVMPERTPTSGYGRGSIAVYFDPLLSAQEQVAILSSYVLTGSYNFEGYWAVGVTSGQEIEWCGIIECNPHVDKADLAWFVLWNTSISQPTIGSSVPATRRRVR